ncbi:MAG TPA: glycosyltransferase [Herpetosiphonaceae bacterium]|nr:glycosyltransferase [Herpetosiphonaceae bacterium]
MTHRVLHVIDQTGPGGAQAILYELLRDLKDEFSFGVAVLGTSGDYSAQYADLGVPVYTLGSETNRWSPSPIVGLFTTIRRDNYALVHSHLFKATILGSAAGCWAGRKTLVHDHSGLYPASLHYHVANPVVRTLYLAAYRRTLARCDGVVVLTEATRDAYLQAYAVDPSKLHVIPNGVDLHRFDHAVAAKGREGLLRTELRLSPDSRIVMMVGRLEREKDWITFLKVAHEVQRRTSQPCAFVIVGSGTEEASLRAAVQRQGLQEVVFLGHRTDVASLLSQADVLLLTSRREAFGLVVIEAMAAGCPVVATRSGGPEAIIHDEVNGLLADVGDVQGLAHHVLRLLQHEVLRQQMAVRGQQLVMTQYSLPSVVDRMAGTYHRLLAA